MASQAVETAMEAEVVESLPNDLFRLELLDGKSDGKSSVTAHISPRSEKDFLRLLPGDRVRVQRAGDVIPQVLERVEEPGRERAEPWRMPRHCPSCGFELIERGPFTVCLNSFECHAQLAGRIRTVVHQGHVHAGYQTTQDIGGFRSGQVQRQAALAPVVGNERTAFGG